MRDSGRKWCFVRGDMCAADALTWVPSIRATRSVRSAYGQAVVVPIHEADLAAVAARALLDSADHDGVVHTVIGPGP